jgi:hypothetical protein
VSNDAVARHVSVLRKALAGFRGDLTVADAAARSGLSLTDAESALRALLRDVNSHLAATDQGELVYSFPHGLDASRTGSLWSKAWGFVKAGGKAVARVFARTIVGVFLVGYAIVFALLIFVASVALSIAAEDSAPTEAASHLLGGVVYLLIEALYWSVHPFTPYSAERAFQGDRKKHTASFYQKVNNFFFGPATAPEKEDPLDVTRRVLAVIRAKQGRIGVLDVMQVARVERAEADALLAKLMLDYEGDVDVSDDGAILYRFEKLRRTVGPDQQAPSPSIYAPPLPEVAPLTGNGAGANAGIIALVLFNALMGWLGIELGMPALLGVVPFVGSLALLAFPIARLLARPFLVARTKLARAAQRVRTLVMKQASEGVTEDDLVAAFSAETGRAPKDGELTQLLTSVAQEIDVVTEPVPLMDGSERDRTRYRFRDLEAEVKALEAERAAAPAHEREVGEVVFTSRE